MLPERERPTDTIFVKSIQENYPLKNSSFFSPSTQAHLKLLCWLVSLLGILQLQEVLNGKHGSCRPPQLRPRLRLVISAALSLCLFVSPCPACWVWENSVWETLSWTLGVCATAGLSLLSTLAWGTALKRCQDNFRKAQGEGTLLTCLSPSSEIPKAGLQRAEKLWRRD